MADNKKYHLTDEETKNLIGREMAMDYLNDLMVRDINMYLYMDIIPRLGLDPKGKYTLSKDKKWLEVTEESKIITNIKMPNGKSK